jgi:hypothetical protein
VALEGFSNALGPRVRPSKRCYRASAESLLPDNAPITEKSLVRPVAASLVLFPGSDKLFSRKCFRVNPGRVTLGACT